MKKSNIESSEIAKKSKKQGFMSGLSTAVMAFVAIALMQKSAMAHPGHDHAANESMLMHAIFYGSIVVVVAICAWFTYRHFSKQNSK